MGSIDQYLQDLEDDVPAPEGGGAAAVQRPAPKQVTKRPSAQAAPLKAKAAPAKAKAKAASVKAKAAPMKQPKHEPKQAQAEKTQQLLKKPAAAVQQPSQSCKRPSAAAAGPPPANDDLNAEQVSELRDRLKSRKFDMLWDSVPSPIQEEFLAATLS